MYIKEQESHLSLNMVVQIVLSIIVWMGLLGFVASRLWNLRTIPKLPANTIVSVPNINQKNIDILRISIKSPPPGSDNLPVSRPEPFD